VVSVSLLWTIPQGSQRMSMAVQERPSSASSPLPSTGHKLKGCSPIQKYEMLEKLGEGTFGYVSL
jgi:hypothetical protein